MRRAPLLVVLAAAAVGAWLVYSWIGRGDPAPEYVTARVDRGTIVSTVTATGTVNPVVTVQVGTYVSGPIQNILVDFNSAVTKGQLLAKIDPRPFQVKVDAAAADVDDARAKLQKDRADLELKRITLERTRKLSAPGIVAQSDLDLAVSNARQAEAQIALDQADIEAKQAALQEAKVNLEYTDIVSPVDGVVVSRNVDVGQTVAATFQTPTLFQVAEDLTKMQVLASVSESDIGAVAPGQDAAFTVDAYPGTTFHGRVTQVRNAPVAVQNVVTYDVVATVANEDRRLKPGMTANVTLTTSTVENALRVSTSALRFRPPLAGGAPGAAAAAERRPDAGPRVWKVGAHGEPEAVHVKTGVTDDRYAQVTEGLAEGDAVIVAVRREAGPTVTGRPPTFGGGPPRRGAR